MEKLSKLALSSTIRKSEIGLEIMNILNKSVEANKDLESINIEVKKYGNFNINVLSNMILENLERLFKSLNKISNYIQIERGKYKA